MTLPELAGRGDIFEAPRSLYIHIPFCSSRCDYCDFHSFAVGRNCDGSRGLNSFAEPYVDALLRRVTDLKTRLRESIQTLYIGGGTPTVLPQKSFLKLLKTLAVLFGTSLKEWTVEANPESLSQEKLAAMLDAGVSRLSIGIQSMDDRELEILGRGARKRDNERALALARRSKIQLSADLIAGIPGQKLDGLASSVQAVLDAGVDHVSLYDLSIEEGTVLEKKIRQGLLLLPPEEASFSSRKHAEEMLMAAGYNRYEVSNFCPVGKESLHNSTYWSMNSYLGIGSGAVSSLLTTGETRTSLIQDIAPELSSGALDSAACFRIEEGRMLDAYMTDPDASMTTSWINRKDSAFELVMMGLRTSRGVDRQRFLLRFGKDLNSLLDPVLKKWKDRFIQDEKFLRLDDRGLDLLNPILLDILNKF